MTRNYHLENGLCLELELDTPLFGLTPEDLFAVAARRNEKRAFLFVSKVLGKHLPIRPAALLAAGKLLALAHLGLEDGAFWVDLVSGRQNPEFSLVWDRLESTRHTLEPEEKTLFIGFAETATGLGRAVADCFDGAMAYVSTTRLEQPGLSPLTFDEAHSHARTHLLYLTPNEPFLAQCKRAVLVDDEFTTGNTALRLVELLHGTYGIRHFTLMTLLDNSDGDNRRALETKLGITIEMCALLKGSIVSAERGTSPVMALTPGQGGAAPDWRHFDGEGTAYRPERQLLDAPELARQRAFCKTIAAELPRMGETLYLGSGELIYTPALIAGLLGGGCYHSSTQSPVFPVPGSAIVSGVHCQAPDCYSSAGYLYNVPEGAYRRVVLFSEGATLGETGIRQLTGYLMGLGVEKVTVAVL